MVESEEPHPFCRNWAIPWLANAAIWSLTVSAVVGAWVVENPKLLIGPITKLESEALLSLADPRTVVWPVAVATALLLLTWVLSRRPSRKREGRKAGRHLYLQLVDELRSFALNAGSMLAITCYYAQSTALLGLAIASWLLWVALQLVWLRKHAPSPLEA